MSVRPRQLGFTGRVSAHGFVVDPEHVGEACARRRVLDLVRGGAIVRRVGPRYVVLLGRAVQVHAQRAEGAPLVRVRGRLSVCPLEEDELEWIPQSDALVLLEGGQARVFELDGLEPVDPSTWIDLSGYARAEVEALGAPPPPPAPPPAPPSARLRDHIAGVPEPAREVELMKAALRGEQAGPWPEAAPGPRPGLWARVSAWLSATRRAKAEPTGRSPGRAGPSGAPSPQPGLLGRLAGLAGLAAWLRAQFPSPAERSPAADQSLGPAEPPAPSRLREALADLWIRFAFRSRLAQALGRRQARYLRDLLDKLSNGDLEDALRHAIPLGNEPREPGPPSLGLPRPRGDLALDLGRRGRAGGGGLYVHDEVFDLLRAHYRRAFERLVRAGRIDEAAFVLADLLDETDEAVSFLEQHARFALAAELAEARGLAPARVVRQWLLAGAPRRAVQVAKRHGAFAEAIALMATKAESIEQLRLLWGDALAERGAFAEAVDAVWPADAGRPLAQRWIELALEAGGPGAARCLTRAQELMPEHFDRWRAHAEAWWASPAPEAVWTRAALGRALVEARWSAGAARLAQGTLRALAGDVSDGAHHDPGLLKKLLEVSRDPLLRADWPGQRGRPPTFRDTNETLELEVPSTDAGSLPIHDAAPVGKGRLLLALGEAGVRLVTRDARPVRHFDQPAHDLVVSEQGHRALALARRGRLTRVARVDLVHRRAGPWCELALDTYTRGFDGWTWHVGLEGALCTLDPLEARPAQLWRNKDCRATEIGLTPDSLLALHEAHDGLELWRFNLARQVLTARAPVRFGEGLGRIRLGPPNPRGEVPFVARALAVDPEALDEGTVRTRATIGVAGARPRTFPVDLPPAAAVLAVHPVGNDWVGVVSREVDVAVVQLYRIQDGVRQVRLRLHGTRAAGLRFDPPLLTVFDDRGRVLGLDLETGRLVRSIRVR